MDPYSVAKGALLAFRDVYLVTKFITRAVRDVKAKEETWKKLQDKFEHELTVLGYFGHLFLQRNDALDASIASLDCQPWLEDARRILERQSGQLMQYQKLAVASDPSFQRLSSVAPDPTEPIALGLLESPTDVAVVTNTDADPEANDQSQSTALSGMGNSKTLKDHLRDMKFVLFGKKKLEELLVNIKVENTRLKDLVPFILATHPRYRPLRAEDLAQSQQSLLASLLRAMTFMPSIAFHDGVRRRLLPSHQISPLPDQTPDRDSEFISKEWQLKILATPTASKLLHGKLINQVNSTTIDVLVEYRSDLTAVIPEDSLSVPATIADGQNDSGRETVDNLAKLLASGGNPDFHTLPFRGVLSEKDTRRYAFIFDYPSEDCDQGEVVGLYSLLGDKGVNRRPLSLNLRFHLASTLATTINSFHVDGWIHKSISSRSVAFFRFLDTDPDYSKPYLLNFAHARLELGKTDRLQLDVDEDIYRHPKRQGQPSASFSRIHDIYALGVLLLEIGLWKTANDIFSYHFRAEPNEENVGNAPQAFVAAAERYLPQAMGEQYSKAVKLCLSDELVPAQRQTNFGFVFRERVVKNLDFGNLGLLNSK